MLSPPQQARNQAHPDCWPLSRRLSKGNVVIGVCRKQDATAAGPQDAGDLREYRLGALEDARLPTG